MYVVSDLHFLHKKVKDFCPETRPWESLEEMTEALIQKWNDCVTKNGTKMFHLGDFCFGTPEQADEIASRLKGDITFISGNHCFSATKKRLAKYGKVLDYAEIKYNKKLFTLCHYPFLDWRNKAHGSIMLHGHEHGALKDTEVSRGKTMDVGWDAVGKFLHFDEILEIMSHREIMPIGHH